MEVEGSGFTIQQLEDGCQAYGNRKYALGSLPALLDGLQFTRVDGGERAIVRVTSSVDTDLLVLTSFTVGTRLLADWEAVDSQELHYTDSNNTKLGIFRRRIFAGQQFTVPQISWTGTMVAGVLRAKFVEKAVDFSRVPGIVIDHSPLISTQTYVGSPSIVQWVDPVDQHEYYVASHDQFGPSKKNSTLMFRSADRGLTWKQVSGREGIKQYWSSLFVHQGKLYILGPLVPGGQVAIRRSDDGGITWTEPTDSKHGLLLEKGRFHCAPQPILVHRGRLWRGMETLTSHKDKSRGFWAFMMSVPVDADLLDAANWTCSNRVPPIRGLLGGKFHNWLEGNAVATPAGEVVNILRTDVEDSDNEQAAVIAISADGKTATFDPQTGFRYLPGACKKFVIRFDPFSKLYWAMSNAIPQRHRNYNPERARNTLVLMSSPDLKGWKIRSVVAYHPDMAQHGFQYPDWQFDGKDIIAVSRTACDDGLGGANNQHDANFMTFHRIENFREIELPVDCELKF